MLCATFPTVPVVALTATANRRDIEAIRQSLNLKNPLEVIGNPNRPNIFYKKVFRQGDDLEFFKEILEPMAHDLKEQKVLYPTTVMYLPLRWCGYAYKYFESRLGNDQYFPSSGDAKPENRLFAQYHAPQTTAMKEQILKELSSSTSKVRLIFATIAMGMCVDIKAIRQVIHVGPPQTVREYFQETLRAGRNGQLSVATLYYNNRDIVKNREGLSDEIRTFCHLEDSCLRKFLLESLDAKYVKCLGHLCCSYCELVCDCDECLVKFSQVNCLP